MLARDTERLWQRAQRYVAANQAAPAQAVLESILVRDPGDTRARVYLAGVYAAQDCPRAAAGQVCEATKVPSSDVDLVLKLASMAIRVGEDVAARELLCGGTPGVEPTPQQRVSMALLWQLLGDNQAALDTLEKARVAGADGAAFHFQRATQLGFDGDLASAESELEQCIRRFPPLGPAFIQIAQIRKQTTASNHLALIDAALARVDQEGVDAAALQFARYKELEDLGRHGEAWQALQRGNALVHARCPHDAAREAAVFDGMIDACTSAFVGAAVAGETAGPQPIFVVGMPRSGTTVLERILGNHSRVESAGELGAFPLAMTWAIDHWLPGLMPDAVTLDRLSAVDWSQVARRYLSQSQWRAHGKPFYVDKLPRNWMWAGLIHKALPHARILNLVRDPMDVCFSNWRAYLGEGPEYAYAYELGSLAAHHRQYARVTAHWHRVMPDAMLDVDYARLVRDPEAVTREVFAFCGLGHEAGCTDLLRNRAPSATLSAAQVRQPIHGHAFRQWAPYASQLADLSAALAATSSGTESSACH